MMMKSLPLSLVASLLLGPALSAQTAPPPPAVVPPPVPEMLAVPPAPAIAPLKPKTEPEQKWVFSLLPKAFQKNPNLEVTVITEMTDIGKKTPPVTREHPAYYTIVSSGYHQLGDSNGTEKLIPPEEIERLLEKALSENGYHPAEAGKQPPSLAVFYMWGTHNLLKEGDEDNPVLSGNQIARNLLDRASLVGGEKFARQLLEVFQEADAASTMNNIPTPPGGQPIMPPEVAAFSDPVHLFKMRSQKNEALLDQTANDVYFVVASAYDYKSLAEKKRVLLWRTRMTVAANGVSQEQSLPALIASASPYFGRDMDEADTLVRHPVQDGKVEIGTPVVVPDSTKSAPAGKKSK